MQPGGALSTSLSTLSVGNLEPPKPAGEPSHWLAKKKCDRVSRGWGRSSAASPKDAPAKATAADPNGVYGPRRRLVGQQRQDHGVEHDRHHDTAEQIAAV